MNFFSILNTIANAFLNFMILVSPPANSSIVTFINSAINSFRQVYSVIDWIFPVDHIFIVTGFIMAIESLIMIMYIGGQVLEAFSFGIIKRK